MPEYISREAAIKSTWMILEGMGYPRSENRSLERTVEAVFQSAPAADVVEVRHASWMAENSRPKSGIFYCSCCHRTCYDPQPTRAKGWTKRCRYHYCPSCGAKMDGGQDDV